ncbi:hypothetical protein Poli38472_000470 [Pythium oligandrum]|uniref:Uncharacterized protein n=1 Tax=Pythium oligandrum TaxID=41045 RepID=A0A8K1CD53_PYTOL|nr:hypothetical protein Poli38472_000470 [Pythium oligandrum]|eukprot:TMW60428.1 hypothetical protein Poli38472_000470 [Pythium oligandrum]
MSSKVKDGLFLGDIDAAQDAEFLQLNGIVHIINCVPRQVPNLFQQSLGLSYVTCDLDEILRRSFFDLRNREFMGIVQLIDRALEHTQSVLVHSLNGINRSPSIMIGYLMVKYCWGVDKAYEFLLTKRADIKPHESYIDQLCALETQLQSHYGARATEQQMFEWHPKLADQKNDELVLIHTFLNSTSPPTGAPKKLDENKNIVRRLTWVDHSTQLKKLYPSLLIKPERPPNHSYNDMLPANASSVACERSMRMMQRTLSFMVEVDLPTIRTSFVITASYRIFGITLGALNRAIVAIANANLEDRPKTSWSEDPSHLWLHVSNQQGTESAFLINSAGEIYGSTEQTCAQPAAADNSASMQLLLCSRCGIPSGCHCGWRSVHSLIPQHRDESVAHLLRQFAPSTSSSRDRQQNSPLYLRVTTQLRLPEMWLEAAVAAYKVVDPIVEAPRAVYSIKVEYKGKQWSVQRRYREFEGLHEELRGSLPTTVTRFMPRLPTKTWSRSLDESFLAVRRNALSVYLRDLLLINETQTSVAALAFLGAISTARDEAVALRREVLHLRVMSYYLDSGDLVLFQSCGPVSALQRSCTGSEWDHVALVMSSATSKKNYMLLEATGEGVTLLPMRSRLAAYSAYHTRRISLRKLQTPLLSYAVREDLLRHFATRVQSCPYGLSLSKLLRTNETSRSTSDYFCSELIADAYKAMGLIRPTLPSSNFWPSSFASGAFVDVELARHGASLDTEVLIDCHLLEVAFCQ